jgi:hypothetical protein
MILSFWAVFRRAGGDYMPRREWSSIGAGARTPRDRARSAMGLLGGSGYNLKKCTEIELTLVAGTLF